jgi:hypothetical protein
MFIFDGAIETREWRTSDSGFNDVLRAHLEKRKDKAITEVYFRRVLEAAKYCEHSYYQFGPDFDYHVYIKAKLLCEKLGIHGFWVGEGGGDK